MIVFSLPSCLPNNDSTKYINEWLMHFFITKNYLGHTDYESYWVGATGGGNIDTNGRSEAVEHYFDSLFTK